MKRDRGGWIARAVATGAMLAVSVLPASVAAMCGPFPRPYFAPQSGQRLPPNPVLYLFTPVFNGRAVDESFAVTARDAAGQSVPVEIAELRQDHGSIEGYRIRLSIARPGPVRVVADGLAQPLRSIDATFTVDPAWRPPADTLVSITNSVVQSDGGGCNKTRSVELVPSVEAPAYRAEWAASAVDYYAGRRQSTVLPWRVDAAGRPSGEDRKASGPLVELGDLGCIGGTFSWPSWGNRPIFVGLAPLFPDGILRPVNPKAVRIIPPPDPEYAPRKPEREAPRSASWRQVLSLRSIFQVALIFALTVGILTTARRWLRARPGVPLGAAGWSMVALVGAQLPPWLPTPHEVDAAAAGIASAAVVVAGGRILHDVVVARRLRDWRPWACLGLLLATATPGFAKVVLFLAQVR